MVGRTVHRQDTFVGQQVVQQREHRLLVLARVFGIADQDQLFVEIHRDHGFASATMPHRVCLERRAVDHRPFRHKAVQFRPVGTPQQVTDEQGMPGQLGHDAYIQPVQRIGPGVKILSKIVATLHMRQHIGVQPVKGIRSH